MSLVPTLARDPFRLPRATVSSWPASWGPQQTPCFLLLKPLHSQQTATPTRQTQCSHSSHLPAAHCTLNSGSRQSCLSQSLLQSSLNLVPFAFCSLAFSAANKCVPVSPTLKQPFCLHPHLPLAPASCRSSKLPPPVLSHGCVLPTLRQVECFRASERALTVGE